MDCIYCTPEWLDECGKAYPVTPRFPEPMKKLNIRAFFRITAEPAWGIEKDFIFGGIITHGELSGLRFYSEEEAKEKADVILTASPQQWKLLLTKQHKFITDFMLKKVRLEQGTIPAVLAVAPYADTFVDALTQVNLIFQDDLSPEQLNEYHSYAAQFRPKLGI